MRYLILFINWNFSNIYRFIQSELIVYAIIHLYFKLSRALFPLFMNLDFPLS